VAGASKLMPTTSVTTKIDTEVYRGTKAAASLAGKSMQQWVEEALRKALPPQFRKGLKS